MNINHGGCIVAWTLFLVIWTGASLGHAQDFKSSSILQDRSAPQVRNPALREEFLKRMEMDQAARKAVIESSGQSADGQPDPQRVQDMRDVDTANRDYLKAYLAKTNRWPGKSEVGKDGAHAAWMIVQHSDADRKFQNDCLQMMRSVLQETADEIERVDVAYLTDRILVGGGFPQRFGTQVMVNDQGEFKLAPVADPEKLDARRAGMGLQSKEEYLQSLRLNYARARGKTTNR